MSIIHPSLTSERILQKLVHGPRSTSEVLDDLKKETGITKQAFYTALRALISEEAVVKYKDHIALDTIWISKLQDMIAMIEQTYSVQKRSNLLHFLSLNDGESVAYKFNSVVHLDQFWGHVQNVIIANTSPDEPLLVYDPHYWFFIGRPSTEKQLLSHMTHLKRPFLMSVGGNTRLDNIIKREASNKYMRFNTGEKLFPKNSYYVTVVEDYVWEVTLDPDVANEIDDLFETHNKITPELTKLFEKIITRRSKNKLKIMRDKTKAEKLRKKLGKNFYIKKK